MSTLVEHLLGQPAAAVAIQPGAAPAAEPAIRFGDVADVSAQLAHALREHHGVEPGDRVGLLLEPGAAFIQVLVAVWRARAAALVLTPLHPAKERARLLDDAGAGLMIASPGLAAVAADGPSATPVHVFASTASGTASLDGRALPPPPGARALLPAADDLALLVYTSGTTSLPKGVLLRHHHLEAQCDAIAQAWQLRSDDVLVHALPLHHVHGLVIALLSVLRVGGSAIMLPSFDAHAVVAACARASLFMGVPTMYARLLDALAALAPEARATAAATFAQLRLCTSGSAGLPVSLGERWARYAGRYPVERFGMTELGVALSNHLHGERVPGSVGWPLPGVRLRVVGDGGDVAAEGELQVAGPTVFEGYWQRPDATAAAFVMVDGVRWFRTGDTVRRHADGRVSVLGRTSVDILKSAGYKLSAPAIEEALRRHPDVRDAAVVGLPDETYGQVVAAAVMLRPGTALTAEGLLAFARAEIAPYALPRLVRFVDDVPRNAMGKVIKPALADLLASPEGSDAGHVRGTKR